MEVRITIGGLELKVSFERKQIYVRGHLRMINGRKVYVKPHFRRR